MSTKLTDLADKLGLSQKELKDKIKEFGFELSPKARVIDDETAELVLSELSNKSEEPAPAAEVAPEETDVAELYDEMISQQREREIVKTQRKKTAGKSDKVASPSTREEQEKENAAKKSGEKIIEVPDVITVKEFAEKTDIKAAKIIGELMKNGILANINQEIDFETAQVIADDMKIKIQRKRVAANAEDFFARDISNLLKEDDKSLLKERPAVVCVMGHVDHGKTKLLDRIREANVIATEAGGITQHIGAYQVMKKGKLITFLDTPGHEAFTEMRARGAKVTDIAILVVAADEGVKPQTVEALNHAKEAKVPIIVALNKMDKPDVNPDRVKAELAENGLQPEEWGGNTVMVPISALTGDGIDTLLDMVLLTSEMLELKANPDREAVGTVVEAHLDHSVGPVATILVNTGTLHITDNVVVGDAHGKIKLMRDHTGKSITIAPPSTPVLIAGLSQTPKSGDILQVVKNEKVAKEKAEEVQLLLKKKGEEKGSGLNQAIMSVAVSKSLKIVLKADTKGSLEAIIQSLAKVKDESASIKIIHSGVGLISKSDLMMASASNGIVVGFHTDFDSPIVSKIAEKEGVEVRKYLIIYDLINEMKAFLSGMLEPDVIETVLGRAQLKQIFLSKKNEMIIGCKVLSGKLQNKAKVRIIRGLTAEETDNIAGKGLIDSLKKGAEVVKEIGEGNECGIKYRGDVPLFEGDILEAYIEEYKKRVIA